MERIIIPNSIKDEDEDNTVRPVSLDEFIGQNSLKESLKIIIEASKIRGDALDHMIFSGPPGLGKTTLANILAHEMDADILITSGPVLKPGDLVGILTSLKKGDVLFIDEIHRLNQIIEEILYPAMEDFEIDIMVREGSSVRPIKLNLERFTLIGATTKVGFLSSPFRNRFGFAARLNLYTDDELVKVVHRSSSIFCCPLTDDGAMEVAKRSRGTPRIANRLLRRVRDYAIVKRFGEINREIVDDALKLLGIDEFGLDDLDRHILKVIADDFNGGPVGIKNISISIGEDIRTIEEVYEPFLIHIGLIKRTLRGREITTKAMKHLNNLNEINLDLTQRTIPFIPLTQRKFQEYFKAMVHIIPFLRENIEKNNEHKIIIEGIDLAKNMGNYFENISENAFLSGIKYTLFQNNLFLERIGKNSDGDQTLLVIRERIPEDVLPKYLQ